MEKEHLDYYRDTSSEEFLDDLRAILADGDCMIPLRLIRNINYMTGKYIEAQRRLGNEIFGETEAWHAQTGE